MGQTYSYYSFINGVAQWDNKKSMHAATTAASPHLQASQLDQPF